MVNILRKPSRRAKLPRHGHDLSKRVLFTSSVGHLLPVFFDYLDAGDKIRINDRLFTRTQPLKTCAFVRVKEYIDYFFVPICQIDPYHGNAKYGIKDFHNTNDIEIPSSSNPALSGYNVPNTRPVISYYDFYHSWNGNTATPSNAYLWYSGETPSPNYYSAAYDQYGIPVFWNMIRLMDMLQYGSRSINTFTSTLNTSFGFNPNLLAVYQKIWFDFYRLSDWSISNPYCYNLGYYIKTGSFDNILDTLVSAQVVPATSFTNASSGNLFTLRYRPLKKDFFTNIQSTPLFNQFSGISGYGNNYPSPDSDVFNTLLMSTYGVSIQNIGNGLNQSNKSNYGVTSTRDIPLSGDGANQTISQTAVTASGDTGFGTNLVTTSQIRLAFAYERLLSITQRAGRHYDDQVRAHLGYNIPQGVSGETYYIGSHAYDLFIGEVVGTAAGNDGSDSTSILGEIAGRGLTAMMKKNRDFKFTAPDDGYIMAIYSAVPEVEYKDYGIYKLNLYTSINQWPRPEFDRLGMQPLFALQATTDIVNPLVGSSFGNYITGWQYRWSELKMSFDIVHGAFNHTLSDWSSSIYFGQYGVLEASLYCPPTYLDGIFALTFEPPHNGPKLGMYSDDSVVVSQLSEDISVADKASTTSAYYWDSSLCYQRDPLLHSIDFKYYKTSWMSSYGLPNL